MSGFPRITCRGAPRDLGLDQGIACREQIRALVADQREGAWAALALAIRPAAALRAALRDTDRYFPHMAERRAGIARGARVSARALTAISLQVEPAPQDALRIVEGARGPCVARALPPESTPVLRDSAPDRDFRSLELVALSNVAPFVGVNERGLAVGVALVGEPDGACAAPVSLLAQDCLQRFDCVEKALEWLERRPAGGRAWFALSDATGAAARLEAVGGERRRLDVCAPRLSAAVASRCCIAVADPHARTLGWTFVDGSSGDAALAEAP